jgi:RimJ/RimL family protein N-acetyltransferase
MRNWPLFDLRLFVSGIELRLPNLEDLDDLADLGVDGVHDPAAMPFIIPWTDAEPVERARSTLQYHWRNWATWQPDNWKCEFVAVRNGEVVGAQGIAASNFNVVREVATGSWVGRRHHNQGIGTLMRTAVLHLAFAGLGAEWALSGAFTDNAASLAVSRKLGYEPDGIRRNLRRGAAATEQRLRLSRETWEKTSADVPVQIEGLEPCLPLFGLP